ncbi:hypothetical protein TRICI_002836 [Trichomonascus ciferrii]|uniref:Uncharacterized protein n=1 Tax=Trichomonascus ciferrii TaxID=44093 RepID=A0A642V5F6_9ASCO|nr:hypothetical protein TRICI_002836 [Trichomonascus ciferrii]
MTGPTTTATAATADGATKRPSASGSSSNGGGGKFGWVRRLMTRTSRTAIGPKASSHHHHHPHPHPQEQEQEPAPVDEAGSIGASRRSVTSSVELEEDVDDDGPEEQTEATANQTATTTSSSGNTGQSRVQIIASDRPPASLVSGDNESVGSASKRRSNSQFTVPSVSRTSITTVSPSIQSSDAASTNTQPSSSLAPLQQTPTSGTGGMDTASVITIASSSKHHSRRSFDTNASTMAIAPESLLSRGGSMDSLPNKSLTSSRHLSTASPSFKTDDDDVSIQSGAIVGGNTQSPVVDDASSSHWK